MDIIERIANSKDSYRNQSNDVLEILSELNAVPVQRNKGIDGFLRGNKNETL